MATSFTKEQLVEMDAKILSATLASEPRIFVKNLTEQIIPKGSILCSTGATYRGAIIVNLADKNDPARNAVIGVANENILSEYTSYALTLGLLKNVNTSEFLLGQGVCLWNNGGYAPYNSSMSGIIIEIGRVIKVNSLSGIIQFQIGSRVSVSAGGGGEPIPGNNWFGAW